MNTDDLKAKAAELGEKAQEFINKPEIQEAINKGKEYLDKATESVKDGVKDGNVQDYVEKGKEALSDAKDKLEDFVSEKTGGKGIFGFCAK